jgi:hypothetical protein
VIEGRRRVLNVLAVVEAMREAHPVLRDALTPDALYQVLRAEKIRLMRLPIDEKAYVVGIPPAFTIVVSSERPSRYHTRWAAHELGHVKLHFGDTIEMPKQVRPCRADDPRELEAELFGRLLMLGESATPDHPKIAPLVAAITAAAVARRSAPPPQLPLPLPEKMPVFKPEPPAFEHERAYQRKLVEKGRRRLKPFIDRPAPDDFYRVKFLDPVSGTTRFIDIAGRIWLIYNYRIVTDAGGVRQWDLVRDFMSPDVEFRFFMNTYGVKRVYRFANRRESRAYRASMLDRQVAESKTVPTPLAPRIPRVKSRSKQVDGR